MRDGSRIPNYILLGLMLAPFVSAQSTGLQAERRVLGPVGNLLRQNLEQRRIGATARLSPNGERLAAVRAEGSRLVADIDGAKSQIWDQVGMFRDEPSGSSYYFNFSPDSSRVAYLAREGAVTYLVEGKDKIPIEPENLLHAGTFVYSADSSRYAMIVHQPKPSKFWVVSDGKVFGPFGAVHSLQFSGDGKRLAFVAVKNRYDPKAGSVLYIDDQPSPSYRVIEQVQLSYDGRHWAFAAAGNQDGWRVYKNGQPVPGLFAKVEELRISPDGKHLAFHGNPTTDGVNSDGALAYVDGTVSKKYASVTNLRMSADGTRAAYIAQLSMPSGQPPRYVAVVDGKESRDYASVLNDAVHFSSDSRHVGVVMDRKFILFDGKEYESGNFDGTQILASPTTTAIAFKEFGDDNTTRIYINGEKGPDLASADLDSIVFSRDGLHSAYRGMNLAKQRVIVIDKKVQIAEAEPFWANGSQAVAAHSPSKLAPMTLTMSPDGKHLVYHSGGRIFLDSKPGPACWRPSPPRFSEDSAHFAMACIENNAQTAKKKFTVLLDGVIGPPVDVLIDTSADAWRFISNNVLVFPAISGEELVSFRVRLPAGEMTAFNERAVSQSTTATNQPATNAPPSNAPPSNQPPPATGDSLGSIKDKVNDLKKKIRIFGSKP